MVRDLAQGQQTDFKVCQLSYPAMRLITFHIYPTNVSKRPVRGPTGPDNLSFLVVLEAHNVPVSSREQNVDQLTVSVSTGAAAMCGGYRWWRVTHTAVTYEEVAVEHSFQLKE